MFNSHYILEAHGVTKEDKEMGLYAFSWAEGKSMTGRDDGEGRESEFWPCSISLCLCEFFSPYSEHTSAGDVNPNNSVEPCADSAGTMTTLPSCPSRLPLLVAAFMHPPAADDTVPTFWKAHGGY